MNISSEVFYLAGLLGFALLTIYLLYRAELYDHKYQIVMDTVDEMLAKTYKQLNEFDKLLAELHDVHASEADAIARADRAEAIKDDGK
jgi:hypothetical protein